MCIRLIFLFFCLSVCAGGHTFAAEEKSPLVLQEYEVKAAFLQNFSLFVEWPAGSESKPWEICVLGENPFARALDSVVKEFNKDAEQTTRKVRYLNRIEDIDGCRILYISDSEVHRQQRILDYVKERDIITVSSIGGFARKGGMIEFFRQHNKIRFYINLPVLKAAKLEADANLLRVATVISGQ